MLMKISHRLNVFSRGADYKPNCFQILPQVRNMEKGILKEGYVTTVLVVKFNTENSF